MKPHERPREVSAEELRELRSLAQDVDEVLEASLKEREGLVRSMARLLPRLLTLTGASGAVVQTKDETLAAREFGVGSLAEGGAGLLAQHPWGVHAVKGGTFLAQPLYVHGSQVGALGLRFEGGAPDGPEVPQRMRMAETIAEELDTVLVTVHIAAEKHALVLELGRLLGQPLFERGVDQALLLLSHKLSLPNVALLYPLGANAQARLSYRLYRQGHLAHTSAGAGASPEPLVERVVAEQGPAVLRAENVQLEAALQKALPKPGAQVHTVPLAQTAGTAAQGKLVVWGHEHPFGPFAQDLLHVLCAQLSQRLVEHQRERARLGQTFPPDIVDALLVTPDYEDRLLPRDEEVGILFADINGFTRICETVLESPERIGRFVDKWSDQVVRLLWANGGVFDKMVGDCIIGLFGPPFFKASPAERAAAAVKTALDIERVTAAMSVEPEVQRLFERTKLPGLGVAIGLHLARAYCGVVGPNRQYTAFSTGMNQTARLQSLGGFREVLVMEPLRRALEEGKHPLAQSLTYGPLAESAVKNVEKPLRYFRLEHP